MRRTAWISVNDTIYWLTYLCKYDRINTLTD